MLTRSVSISASMQQGITPGHIEAVYPSEKRWAGDEPALYKRDIPIDISFDCLRIFYEWKCISSCGYAIGGVHRSEVRIHRSCSSRFYKQGHHLSLCGWCPYLFGLSSAFTINEKDCLRYPDSPSMPRIYDFPIGADVSFKSSPRLS